MEFTKINLPTFHRFGKLMASWLKRPPKAPDRAYPLVKNQEYAYAYDWEHRPG